MSKDATPKPTSELVLEEANRIIHGERAQTYGPAEDSFARIGALWSAYLDVEVDAYDVAMLMVLMKVSRAKNSPHHDSHVDIAGYAALAPRCALKARRS
jgi:hypothetical protein